MRLETTRMDRNNKLVVSKHQYSILLACYKFRIVTVLELSKYLNLSKVTVSKNIGVLEQENYIVKQYNNSYHLRHQSAYYYLTNKGISIIKKDKSVKPKVLHRLYKKDLTEAGKQHFVDIFKTYNTIRKQYPKLDIYTKQELEDIELKPDLLIVDNSSNGNCSGNSDSNGGGNSSGSSSSDSNSNKQYYVFLAHNTYPFLTKKLISKYIIKTEEEDLPALLIVVKDKAAITSLIRHTKNLLLSLCVDESEVSIAFAVFDELIEDKEKEAIESDEAKMEFRQRWRAVE